MCSACCSNCVKLYQHTAVQHTHHAGPHPYRLKLCVALGQQIHTMQGQEPPYGLAKLGISYIMVTAHLLLLFGSQCMA